MIGTLQPACSSRFLINGTAAAASGTFTVQRTISLPASASSSVCCSVVSTSAVSVLVIDCTTTGAPPPTVTWPTFTPYVFFRGCFNAAASVPAICFNISPILPDPAHAFVVASLQAGHSWVPLILIGCPGAASLVVKGADFLLVPLLQNYEL